MFLLGVGQAYNAHAQCSIVSANYVCLSDFIGFETTHPSNAIGWIWDFGNGQSSTQPKPNQKYGTAGKVTVRVSVILATGDTCKASKEITVEPLPKAMFHLGGSNLCFNSNRICVNDVSQPGLPGNPIVQRVILWGDGAASAHNTPNLPAQVCYSYRQTGTFKITMEVTDIKGCKNIYQQDVTVSQNFNVSFTHNLRTTCDSVEVCLTNTSSIDSSQVASFYWDFGDGRRDSTLWSGVCFAYYTKGAFLAQLVVVNKDGCRVTFGRPMISNLEEITFNIKKNKYAACLDDASFDFENLGREYDQYVWSYWDSITNTRRPIGTKNPQQFNPDFIGKKYISLSLFLGDCFKTFHYDSVDVLGPKAAILPLNNRQCKVEDTVYFHNLSFYYKSYNVVRLWDFGDMSAPQCTSWLERGINIGRNCNFSFDEHGTHFYDKPGCFNPKLSLHDTVTGCRSVEFSGVAIGHPIFDSVSLDYNVQQGCLGPGIPRQHNFVINNLQCYTAWINPDSAMDPKQFGRAPPGDKVNYMSLADTINGWVTVGLITGNFRETRHFSPLDTTGIPYADACIDTQWYHNMYRVLNPPDPSFEITPANGCAPLDVTIRLLNDSQPNVTRIIIDWEEGVRRTINVQPGYTRLGPFTYRYRKSGSYNVQVRLQNPRICTEVAATDINVGYNIDIYYDSFQCAGMGFMIRDSIKYFSDSNLYWHDNKRAQAGKEQMWWDFGDGHRDTGSMPVHVYQNPGNYIITLITLDSTGCYDTNFFPMYVTGVEAGIKDPGKRFLCSDIVQLFDSSQMLTNFRGDSIVSHYWKFGDGKRSSVLKDPWHYYSSFGEFKVAHVVSTLFGCVDTAYLNIVIDGPIPKFEIDGDSIGCVPFTAKFKNTSRSVRDYIWYFGDPQGNTLSTDKDSSVSFTYNQPGIYYIYLYGADSVFNTSTNNFQFCSAVYPDTTSPDAILKRVVVLPIPPVDFLVKDKVCPNERFTMLDRSDPKYTRYRWEMGNGDTVTSFNRQGSYAYTTPGFYTIRYFPDYVPDSNDRDCFDTTSKVIEVLDVRADFEIDTVRSIEPVFYFRNTSDTTAVKFEWDFGHPQSGARNKSTDKDGWHDYVNDTGTFTVCLTAINAAGCRDTACKTVRNTFFSRIFIPNVFTPGKGDGLNDAFDIDVVGGVYYHLQIVNRWGNKVYDSQTDGIGNDGINWNGNDHNTGPPCSPGVYFVVFHYQLRGREQHTYTGTVTLIR